MQSVKAAVCFWPLLYVCVGVCVCVTLHRDSNLSEMEVLLLVGLRETESKVFCWLASERYDGSVQVQTGVLCKNQRRRQATGPLWLCVCTSAGFELLSQNFADLIHPCCFDLCCWSLNRTDNENYKQYAKIWYLFNEREKLLTSPSVYWISILLMSWSNQAQ